MNVGLPSNRNAYTFVKNIKYLNIFMLQSSIQPNDISLQKYFLANYPPRSCLHIKFLFINFIRFQSSIYMYIRIITYVIQPKKIGGTELKGTISVNQGFSSSQRSDYLMINAKTFER